MNNIAPPPHHPLQKLGWPTFQPFKAVLWKQSRQENINLWCGDTGDKKSYVWRIYIPVITLFMSSHTYASYNKVADAVLSQNNKKTTNKFVEDDIYLYLAV